MACLSWALLKVSTAISPPVVFLAVSTLVKMELPCNVFVSCSLGLFTPVTDVVTPNESLRCGLCFSLSKKEDGGLFLISFFVTVSFDCAWF